MSRPAVLLLVLVATLPAIADPKPDEDDADAYSQDAAADLVPRSAKLRLATRAVVIEARYELDVLGPLPSPGATHLIPLPHQGVITEAVVHAGGHTQRLELAASADADKRFDALLAQPTRAGGRMSAVRIDAGDSEATIGFAFPRRTHVRLDLTLEVPSCFSNDARHILIPPAWSEVISGGRLVSGDEVDALDDACGGTRDGKAWVAFGSRELAKLPGGAQRIGTYGSRLPLGKTDVARIELALAKQLTEIPRDLHTVLVVDHSRSLTADELETQRIAVAAYLRAAPRGRVQLVGYARHGKTLLPGWMIASHATTRIDRELRALAPRNGSAVGQGLATAASLLANISGTRRIVLFTDDRFTSDIAQGINIDRYADGLPAHTLVHVVSLKAFGPGLQRDDAHELSPLAEVTEGVVMRAQLDDQKAIDALSLARATSFDNLQITPTGWTSMSLPECPDPFTEGSTCEWLGRGAPAAGNITVEGYLWGTKVTRVVEPDPRDARSLARSLLSRVDALPAELVVPIQRAAQAVNAAWSLIAMWGSGGYGDLVSWGTIGTGRYGTTSRDFIDGVGHPVRASRSPREELLAQLGPVVRRCKPRGVVGLDVELTEEEIVDVSLTIRDARDADRHHCITEGIWDTALVIADAPAHVNVRVDVQPDAIAR